MHLLFLQQQLLLVVFHPLNSASFASLLPPPPPSSPPIVIYQLQQQRRSNNDNNHLQRSLLLLALLEQQDASSSSQASKAEDVGIYKEDDFQSDTVLRVTDANHVRLKRAGLVSLAAVKTPSSLSFSSNSKGSNSGFSECLAYAPDYKLQQLLPAGQPVKVKLYSNNGNNNNRQVSAVILKKNNKNNNNNDSVQIVNQELVAAGFAVVRKHNAAADVLSSDDLKRLENAARLQEKGLFQQCPGSSSSSSTSSRSSSGGSSSKANNHAGGNHVKEATAPTRTSTTATAFFVAEFQPLDKKGTTTRTTIKPPKNPGDKKGCSDFETYEDALRYYEYYYTWYGDVARLDRNGFGIPCPGLPHTQNQVLYRIKKAKPSLPASKETDL